MRSVSRLFCPATVVIAMVREFRASDDKTPVVLMGYANPIEAMGAEKFAAAASKAGVDGVLVVGQGGAARGDLVVYLPFNATTQSAVAKDNQQKVLKAKFGL